MSLQRHGNWIRVSRQRPCPVCGKPDNCEIAQDESVVWCGRVSDGSIRQNAGGQFLHRLKDDPRRMVSLRPIRTHSDSDTSGKTVDLSWTIRARQHAERAEVARAELATYLGVSKGALGDLGVGWNDLKQLWTFPERDAVGYVIGIITRNLQGEKKREYKGRSGLVYADDWDSGIGPVLLVEGPSDTAALRSLGLTVIGRPSNYGGVDLLVELLFDLPGTRDIVVIGERDQKANGLWPGRDGAIAVAKGLADGLEREIAWAFPPDGTKDSRAWLLSMPTELPVARLADLFLTGLEPTIVPPPIVLEAQAPTGPCVSVAEWRGGMLEARIASLSRPGIYLDASETGAGKSHADHAALLQAQHSEVAA